MRARAIAESLAAAVVFAGGALIVASIIHGAFLWHDVAISWTVSAALVMSFLTWLALVARREHVTPLRAVVCGVLSGVLTHLTQLYGPVIAQLVREGFPGPADSSLLYTPAMFGLLQIGYGGWLMLVVNALLAVAIQQARSAWTV